jgi:hypothetical protein
VQNEEGFVRIKVGTQGMVCQDRYLSDEFGVYQE